MVPLLLLSSPGRALSRAAASATTRQHRGHRAGADAELARGSRQEAHLAYRAGAQVASRSRSYVELTPWETGIALADDIVDGVTTTSTLSPVPVIAASFSQSSATTTTTDPPPPTTTTTTTTDPPPANQETGEASWYEAPTGTCASLDITFGTVVTVTDLATGGSTNCTVDDRGPYVDGRIIDLSEQTFSQLAEPSAGVIEVQVSW